MQKSICFEPCPCCCCLPPWRSARPWIAVAGLLLAIAAGCGDKSRRLTESETLEYKRSLVISRKQEIGPKYEQFFYHPARTRGEIDQAFERYVREYSVEQSREAAQFSKNRSSTRTGPESGDEDSNESSAGDGSVSAKARAEKARRDAEHFSNPARGASPESKDSPPRAVGGSKKVETNEDPQP